MDASQAVVAASIQRSSNRSGAASLLLCIHTVTSALAWNSAMPVDAAQHGPVVVDWIGHYARETGHCSPPLPFLTHRTARHQKRWNAPTWSACGTISST